VNRKISSLGILVVAFVFFMNSCASGPFMSVQMDKTYHGGALKKILVVGVMEPGALRDLFEDELVRQLKARGTEGISSHTVVPDQTMPDMEEIESKMAELGVDSVLVARLVDIGTVDLYETYPPTVGTGTFSDYYVMCCRYVVSSGYKVTFETKIFQARNDRAIWSALSGVAFQNSPDDMYRMTGEFTTALIKALGRDGLVK
jgi:hypothetical protein